MFLNGLLEPNNIPSPFFLGLPVLLTPLPCTFLLAKPDIAPLASARAKHGNTFCNE